MKHIGLKIATLGILLTASTFVLAAQMQQRGQMQQHGPMMGAPNYNTATETTLKGSVEAVKQIQGPQEWGGTHLTIKTDKETIDVHVGPSWFLSQQKMSFAKGDQVEVTGSRVKFGTEDALLAREIKKGGQTLTLRNGQGIPAWAGMGRGRGPA